jgi:hypothetical protein
VCVCVCVCSFIEDLEKHKIDGALAWRTLLQHGRELARASLAEDNEELHELTVRSPLALVICLIVSLTCDVPRVCR